MKTILCLAFALASLTSHVWAAEPSQPNIVLLVADDQGWADVGFHDSEIETPNIDRLAQQGTELTQFYVQPTCTPTRSALMTGRYPFRMGMHRQVVRPWHSKGLPLGERFLPESLQDAGYKTAICGKWHLGTADNAYLPLARGFDHQYGHVGGHIEYFEHTYYGALDWHRNQIPLAETGYTTDLIAAESVKLIEQHDASQPLFLYVAFNAPHAPMQAPDAYIKRYENIKDANRRKFAAMSTCMDVGIGRILKAIDDQQMRDNTLVIYFSDNGGATNNAASNLPLHGHKGEAYEGGVRVPAVVRWPGQVKAGTKVDQPLHVVDLFPTLVKLAGGNLNSKLPLDGRDAWPTIAQGKPSPHDEIVHNAGGYGDAIRRGDWKLVYSRPGKGEPYRYELFNIASDPYETKDFQKSNPEIFQDLKQRLNTYQGEVVKPDGLEPQAKPKDWSAPKVWDYTSG